MFWIILQEIKVWSCESWDCIQTIRFEPNPTITEPLMFKAALDLSARYLLLSNIYQKIVYVLQLQPVNIAYLMSCTEISHSNEPFVIQPSHLILSNCFSKQVINPADFASLKIWDQSDNWFKSYGQKVNFLLTES